MSLKDRSLQSPNQQGTLAAEKQTARAQGLAASARTAAKDRRASSRAFEHSIGRVARGQMAGEASGLNVLYVFVSGETQQARLTLRFRLL